MADVHILAAAAYSCELEQTYTEDKHIFQENMIIVITVVVFVVVIVIAVVVISMFIASISVAL